MDGIDLGNILGAEEVEKMFSSNVVQEEEPSGESAEEETSVDDNSETDNTAEVDFSELLGNPPESVGSEKNKEEDGGTPESSNGQGSPQTNLFSSIARAIRDEGVFPDLSDDAIDAVKDSATLRKLFDDEIKKSLDERQQRIEEAINNGATSEEVQQYQNALNISQYLDDSNTFKLLTQENDEGEQLRKRMLYQDYINKGFKHERAVKMIQKSIDDGTDIEDAKEAFNSCKDFYNSQIEEFRSRIEEREQANKAEEQKRFSTLKKHLLDTEKFYGDVSVDRNTRQKAYDAITKPVFKDEQGNYMNALQKYQKENPIGFIENLALLFALTDEFRNVEKLTHKKVQQGIKKGFEEVANVLNTTRRNGDGTLNLANIGAGDEDRENWTLA
jgi:hypothetical protein